MCSDSESELDRLLNLTSRTFALSIPLLPEPIRTQVGVGYLVFRLADTIEDEGVATPAQRAESLGAFKERLLSHRCEEADDLLRSWNHRHRPEQAGYAELLDRGEWVCAQLDGLEPAAAGRIRHHVARTADGMAQRLLSPQDIRDVAGVRAYCYQVAGIVGEMLTELFVLHHRPLEAHRAELMDLSRAFGEVLQLVNILRDQGVDLDAGRRYVPDAAAYGRLLDLAQDNAASARRYLEILRTADTPAGVVEFNAFNLGLAEATLALLRQQGPGVKVDRDVVVQTLARVRVET